MGEMEHRSAVASRRDVQTSLRTAVALALALLAACQQPIREKVVPHEFERQEEAGSGHVSVLSVAPWQDYLEAMKPGFTLTPADALQEVAPDTAVLEDKLLDMLRVVMSVATPGGGTTITKTESSKSQTDATGKVTSTSESAREAKEEEKPGQAEAVDPKLPGTHNAPALPGLGEHGKGALKPAALTHYSLATALLQEVQLLNRYVEHAVTRKGYVPYVVRLRVSLMPKVRTAPYDAYSTLSFLPADESGATDAATGCASAGRDLPAIVPLVVSDDLEAALASDSSETVRQLALALSAMIQGFSINGSVERYTDELVHTVTRNYNSLYTVARLTENTVRVRMGARLHSTRAYFMVPQTHSVTLLLLAPPSWPSQKQVAVTSLTEFVNVDTGVALPGRTLEETGRKYAELLASFGLDKTIHDRSARALANEAGRNDYDGFRRCLAQHGETDERTAQRLWAGFATVTVGGRWASTSFNLPEICPCGLPPQGTWATGADDRTGSLTVELRPAHGIERDRLGATLVLTPGAKGDDAKAAPVRVGATSITYDRARLLLRLGFPSLSQVRRGSDLARDLVETRGWSASLEVDDRCSACAKCASGCPGTYPVSIVSVAKTPEPEDPAVSLVSVPALRGSVEEKGDLVVRVGRKSRIPTGARTVVLQCEFTSSDGKSPAPGILVEAFRGKDSVPVETALNQVTIRLAEGEGTTAKPYDLKLHFEQLADASNLLLSARVDGIAGPEGTRKVLVSVASAAKGAGGGGASGSPAPAPAAGAAPTGAPTPAAGTPPKCARGKNSANASRPPPTWGRCVPDRSGTHPRGAEASSGPRGEHAPCTSRPPWAGTGVAGRSFGCGCPSGRARQTSTR